MDNLPNTEALSKRPKLNAKTITIPPMEEDNDVNHKINN